MYKVKTDRDFGNSELAMPVFLTIKPGSIKRKRVNTEINNVEISIILKTPKKIPLQKNRGIGADDESRTREPHPYQGCALPTELHQQFS